MLSNLYYTLVIQLKKILPAQVQLIIRTHIDHHQKRDQPLKDHQKNDPIEEIMIILIVAEDPVRGQMYVQGQKIENESTSLLIEYQVEHPMNINLLMQIITKLLQQRK